VPEVLEVRTTDDIEFEEPFAGTPPASWRPVLGVIVVIALALGGAYSVFINPRSATPKAATSLARADSVDADVLAAAHAALSDWGRFGVSGDLSVVAPAFDETGPQFARLRQEAGSIAARAPGAPAYTFVMVNPEVLPGASAGERIVRAQIVASRPGEKDQRFQWDLVLRNGTEKQWLLWTVRDRTSTSTATPAGGAAPATG
jgi:hypothetical protein